MMKPNPQQNAKNLLHVFSIGLIILLSSCAVGPDFTPPTNPETQLNSPDTLFHDTVPIANEWWRDFQVTELNQLIDQHVSHNFNLQAAHAALESSQLNLKAGMGVFYPQVSLSATANKQNYFLAPISNLSKQSIYAINTLNANVTYALDIWGGNRRQVESLEAQRDIQQALTEGTQLSLTGNLITTSFTVAAYQDQLKLIRHIHQSLNQVLALYQQQYEAGLINNEPILNTQSQINTLITNESLTEKNLIKAQHLLSSLCSLTPDRIPSITFSIESVHLPTSLPKSVPSYWLKKRPDIKASLAELHVTSALIGVARAQQFPNLSISANVGRASTAFSQLLSGSTEIWGVGANLTQPLFNGGALEANTRSAEARYQESFFNYQQTVINAFQQVADTMTSVDKDHQELINQTQHLDNARQQREIAQANFEAGRINRIQYLALEINEDEARINWLASRVQVLQDTSAWYLALGH